ncbi:MAG: 50S ribosomal protein L31 [Brevinemataceae bacterium]
MKKGIHPELKQTNVTCSCGEHFEIRTVNDSMLVEVCSKCHPFYTGTNRNTERGGMVERFKNRYGTKK